MDNPIAVFYHCKLSGKYIPDANWALSVMAEQMQALRDSGLMDACSKFVVGINGDDSDGLLAATLAGNKASVLCHGSEAQSEIPTVSELRRWLPENETWHVLYHHSKGITHPGNEQPANWRRRMERAVVYNWRTCVTDLAKGFDSVGAHWLTPEQFSGMVTSPFWGGAFYWATSSFLRTLPPLPEANWENRFATEHWIGAGPRRPKVMDYCPGWP